MRAEFYRPETSGYWPIRQMSHYVTDSLALEAIFAAFNVGYADDFQLEAEAADYRATADHGRSMSVGDVVVIIRPLMDGDLRLAYRCENVGWARVDDPAPCSPPSYTAEMYRRDRAARERVR